MTRDAAGKIEFKDDKMLLYVTGYYNDTCDGYPFDIYKMENNQWTPLILHLPVNKEINIDGHFIIPLCDYATGCTKISGIIPLPLKSYKLTKTENIRTLNEPLIVPFYKTTPIKGKIKIKYSYFEDPLCQKEVVFSKEEVIN